MSNSEEEALKEEVLKKLASITTFRNSSSAMRLLKELNKNPKGLPWDKLARRVFSGEREGGGIQTESSAFRSLLYRVRHWLKDAYSDPASPLQQYPRLEIHVDGRLYLLRFTTNGTRPHLSAFWKPYLICEDNARQLQTSDRFFLRLGDHFYFRDIRSPGRPNWIDFLEPLCESLGIPKGPFTGISLNKLQKDVLYAFATQITAFLSNRENWEQGTASAVTAEQTLSALKAKFSPDVSRHYVSAGEAVALTHIAELFQSFQKPVIFGNRVGVSTDNEYANIVQVGKPRAGGALFEILDSRRFRLSSDMIEDTKGMVEPPLKDHLRTHADDIGGDAGSDRVKYALITRCAHRRAPQIITSIVASHGRVTEAACRHLTSEISMATLFNQLKWNASSAPPLFQFVLKAEIAYGKDADRTTATILGAEPGWLNLG